MNVAPRMRIVFSSPARTRGLFRRVVNLCLGSILILNMAACHDSNPGQHQGISPLAATLIGVAAEVGVLALSKNRLAASAASGVVGAGASYIIDEIGLTCKACGTASTYSQQNVMELAPRRLGCSNEACSRFAYLVVSNAQDSLDRSLDRLKANLQPTCLLTRETTAENEIKLKWVSHNATDASLDGQAVSPNGSTLIHPDHTSTYKLKVIGVTGSSEDSLTIEVAQPVESEPDEEADEAPAPPPQPPAPPEPPVVRRPDPEPPAMTSTRVVVYLDRIEVFEDGSLSATDWSFEIFLNERGVITIPKRSYHDDARRLVQFSRQPVDAVVSGDEATLRISGYNFDEHRRAEGRLRLPVNLISGTTTRIVQVAVPEDQKKGYFLFYVTITK